MAWFWAIPREIISTTMQVPITTPTNVSAVRPLRRKRFRAERLIQSISSSLSSSKAARALAFLRLRSTTTTITATNNAHADYDQHPAPNRHAGLLGFVHIEIGIRHVIIVVHFFRCSGKIFADGARVAAGILVVQGNNAGDVAGGVGGNVKVDAALGAGIQVAQVLVVFAAQVGAGRADSRLPMAFLPLLT